MNNRTTTIQQQLLEALMPEDSAAVLVCFWRNQEGEYVSYGTPLVHLQGPCGFSELPTRPFDSGYGSTEGEPTIAFSERYVYIRTQYDGAESFEAIPRHPQVVQDTNVIPWPGG